MRIMKPIKKAKRYTQAVIGLILLTFAAVPIALAHIVTGQNPLKEAIFPADYNFMSVVLG